MVVSYSGLNSRQACPKFSRDQEDNTEVQMTVLSQSPLAFTPGPSHLIHL